MEYVIKSIQSIRRVLMKLIIIAQKRSGLRNSIIYSFRSVWIRLNYRLCISTLRVITIDTNNDIYEILERTTVWTKSKHLHQRTAWKNYVITTLPYDSYLLVSARSFTLVVQGYKVGITPYLLFILSEFRSSIFSRNSIEIGSAVMEWLSKIKHPNFHM